MGTNSDDPPSGATGVRSKGAIRLEKRRRFYSRLLAELQKELGAKPGKGKKKIMQHHLLAMAIKWLNEHGNDEVGGACFRNLLNHKAKRNHWASVIIGWQALK
eukprot:comp22534_c0_seq2/m.34221 comp22534_c0_seq2/g.34221  ORF comp22534_c0_seq2/g.34221 comp22534_c0_seq2/m.34221 type:complete len:103 (-) comp22534_c0_seq2:14-322(-)